MMDPLLIENKLAKLKKEIIEEEKDEEYLPNFVVQAGKQKLENQEEIKFEITNTDEMTITRKKSSKKSNSIGHGGTASKSLKRKNFFQNEVLHLECEWDDCCETAGRMEDFMRHMAIHVRESEVRHNPAPLLDVFACLWTGCGFECSNSEEIVRHIHFHSFHTKIKCHGSNMLTDNELAPCNLDSAQRNILPDLSQPFMCEWEGCEFGDENWQMPQNFYWHVKNHPEELRGLELKCRWRGCTKVDTSVSKIKEHMRCHSQEKMVGCPTCGGMFANRIKFLDHCVRQQVSEHSFSCTNCSKKFANERHLRDHMRSHINHFKCQQCDMTCGRASTLKKHIKYRHTKEKPFACEFCAYRGKTQADIKSHLRIHYNEAEMKCPEKDCQFTCRAKMTMKQHQFSAHKDLSCIKNLPVYACHLCEVRFDRGAYLTKHLTKTHSYSWPSGHSRFKYTMDPTSGLFRLQTIRFESVFLQQEPDWDMDLVQSFSGPLSVKSCPEFESSQHQQTMEMQPLSILPCLDEIDQVEACLDEFDEAEACLDENDKMIKVEGIDI